MNRKINSALQKKLFFYCTIFVLTITTISTKAQCQFDPVFVAPTPTCGSTISATVGAQIFFSVQPSDPDGVDIHFTLSSGALPVGAVMSPPLPEFDNPPSSEFVWTPGAGQVGQHTVTFIATDDCGAVTSCDITIDVAAATTCDISAASIVNAGSCNNNNSIGISTDDYFTADVQVTFSNPPVTGNLQIVLPGDVVAGGGSTSVSVSGLSSPHTFTGIRFKADGTVTNVNVNFTADQNCTRSITGPTVQPCSTPPPSCDISTIFLGSPSSCNDNGTPNDASDDFFTQDVQAIIFAPPTTGNLQIVPGGDEIGTYSVPVSSIIGLSHTFTGVKFKADGTTSNVQMNFTDAPTCIASAIGPSVPSCSTQPPPCNISTINFLGNPGPCDDNGTPNDPSDDFFTQNIQANFFNRPSTGNLQIVPGGDEIGTYSIPVGNIIGNTHTFIGVKLKADGTSSNIQFNFTDEPTCINSAVGPTIQSCSTPVAILTLTCPGPVSVSCTPAPDPSSVSETHLCPGVFTITHLNDANSNVVCINRLTITRTYQGVDQCGNSATCSQIITVDDQTPPTVTCPGAVNVSCATDIPLVDVGTLLVTDNCAGTVGISRSFVSDAITNQSCDNRFTITRKYRGGDACGNTATCTQVITVNDQTPPVINCQSDIVLCGGQQVVNFSTPTATDNCSANVTQTGGPVSGSSFPVGTTLITFTATDACGNSASCSFNVIIQSPTPGAITGPNFVCKNQSGVNYCVTSVPSASYIWTLPPNVTLQSSANGSCITLKFNNNFSGGSLCVKAVYACGTSSNSCLTISVPNSSPDKPGSISGQTTLCANSCETYSVALVPKATEYIWSASVGLSISTGQGPNSVLVCSSNGFTSGSLSVVAKNCKGSSAARTINIISKPGVPVWQNSGGDNLTAGVCPGATVAYEVAPMQGVNTFEWTAPTNAIINDRNGHSNNPLTVTGVDPIEGEYEIDVLFPSGFTSGNVSVKAQNACGLGPAATLAVKSEPNTPGPISGNSPVCKSATKCYSVSSVNGATSYTWNVNNGAVIKSGQGTNSVCLKFNTSTSNSVTLTVKANSACASSPIISKSISLNANCKMAPDGSEIDESEVISDNSIEVYPNPASGRVTIKFYSENPSQKSLIVEDMIGNIIISKSISTLEGMNIEELNLENMSNGVYFILLLTADKEPRTSRVIIE